MRIVLATGIYPPDIGGHSFYAQKLKEALEKQGHVIQLCLYGRLKLFPTSIRHVAFGMKLLLAIRGQDAVIAFDTFSVAVPAGVVARITGKPTLVRAAGDFVWESYIERTHDFLPLPDVYRHRERWNLKERLSFRIIRWALAHVHIVFSTDWIKDIWLREYGFDISRTHVIENAIEPKLESIPPKRKNFLFYSRAIALKNAEAFRRALAHAKRHHPDIELEEGQISHDELLKRMQSSYAVVVPSISEVSPNIVIESLRCGKPFLMTKYSGYAKRFADYGVLVDPLSENDMERGIRELADPAVYAVLTKKIATFNEVHTYDDIAREFVELLTMLQEKSFSPSK
ncbi:MAG: hypothetical protein UY63_C0006G0027 [Parcubacteria group bacterium GW2011_GWA2_51_10]|nr:MAG: hypothetical protein UY63_C0006G0027 [Parcubacteria group bacterium GW2011_GWA2_51_10]